LQQSALVLAVNILSSERESGQVIGGPGAHS